MQFIPSTWAVVGVHGDNDDRKNSQDIDDAALATGVYLCAGEGDLTDSADERAAVLRYNHSDEYADLVIRIAEGYRSGDYTMLDDYTTSSPVLTDLDNDYSPAPVPDREPRD
jgi:membrane-bound lytic murein transglycosylase B